MPRKILLIEPNYKNKYPPMALMKLATYFRMRGDDVKYFKGDLKELAAEIVYEELLTQLNELKSEINWRKYKQNFINYIRRNRREYIDDIKVLTEIPFALSMLQDAQRDYKNKSYFTYPAYDKVAIMTLFTFYWNITIDTINFVKNLCKTKEGVLVGGIMSTLVPNEVYEATGVKPIIGLLNHKGDIDPDNELIIDNLPLDYSILEEIDYIYPANNAYFAYMTRGCINKCAFCAVPKLEPTYCDYISLKDNLDKARQRFGEQRDLLLMDNNVLASNVYEKIIDEVKECGFGKGATYIPPNQYEIAINNLRDNYNTRAYIKKCIKLYKELIKRLTSEEKKEFYLLLEKNDCLEDYTATVEAILSMDSFVAPLYAKHFKHPKPVKRIVDFNQGIDSRLINETNMKKLAEVNIKPLRIAFDHWELRDVYEKAVRTAAKYGIVDLSNYLLYNFRDKPEHLYYRMKLNVELCEELNARIYSFPMKYHPINDPEFFRNRDYIGEHWNRKFIRAVQAVLNSTKGKIGKGKSFFEEAFGVDVNRFNTILWMPETFIIYRFQFKDNLAKDWEKKFYALSSENLEIVKKIVGSNVFVPSEWTKYDDEVKEVLLYYTITREEAVEMTNKYNLD